MCQDTWNLRHKFNFQGPALRILGLGVAISKSQGPISRVLGVKVPCPRVPVPGSQDPGSQGPGVPGLRFQGPRSQVSGPDFRLCKLNIVLGTDPFEFNSSTYYHDVKC